MLLDISQKQGSFHGRVQLQAGQLRSVHRQHPLRVLGGVRGSLSRKQREGMMSAICNLDLLLSWHVLFCYSMS
jgi:hypothetical protein